MAVKTETDRLHLVPRYCSSHDVTAGDVMVCRFGRLTVVTLESKLEARDKEVQQLTRALEKSDEHISSLESELGLCQSQLLAAGSGSTPGTDTVECRVSADDDDDGMTSSLTSLPHQPSDGDTHSAGDSCRKKLKFTTDSRN